MNNRVDYYLEKKNYQEAKKEYIRYYIKDKKELTDFDYRELSKFSYLCKDRAEAIYYSLMSIHLLIQRFMKADDNYETGIRLCTKSYGKDLVQNLIKENKNAIFLLPGNTDHLAHSYYDLQYESKFHSPLIDDYATKYIFRGNEPSDGIKYMYMLLGIDLAMRFINWDYIDYSPSLFYQDEDIYEFDNQILFAPMIENNINKDYRLDFYEVLRVASPTSSNYDGKNLAVYRKSGEIIGYLPKEIASYLSHKMDAGNIYHATPVYGGRHLNYNVMIYKEFINYYHSQ